MKFDMSHDNISSFFFRECPQPDPVPDPDGSGVTQCCNKSSKPSNVNKINMSHSKISKTDYKGPPSEHLELVPEGLSAVKTRNTSFNEVIFQFHEV